LLEIIKSYILSRKIGSGSAGIIIWQAKGIVTGDFYMKILIDRNAEFGKLPYPKCRQCQVDKIVGK